MVGLRPIFTPSFYWCGILKCTWSLLKQREIMKRIKNILLTFVTTGMTGNQFCFVINVNMERIGFERDLASGTTDRNRIAVGFKCCLAVGSEPDRCHFAAVIFKGWQGMKIWFFLFPSLSNGHWLSADSPCIILQTPLDKQLVEVFK